MRLRMLKILKGCCGDCCCCCCQDWIECVGTRERIKRKEGIGAVELGKECEVKGRGWQRGRMPPIDFSGMASILIESSATQQLKKKEKSTAAAAAAAAFAS